MTRDGAERDDGRMVERSAERRLAHVIDANRAAILDELMNLEWAADPQHPDQLVTGAERVRPRATLFLDTLQAGLRDGEWDGFDALIGRPSTRLLIDGVVSAEDLNRRALRVAGFLIPFILATPEPAAPLRALFSTMQFLSSSILGEHNRRLLGESRRLDDLKTMFLRLTGHELRAPLGTIRGYASMLQEGDFGEIPLSAAEAVTAIDTAARSGLGMIDRLVEVARLESGGEALQRGRHSLSEIVTGALAPLRPAADANHLRLEEDVRESSVDVDLEETQIAIRNLVGNAIKYASEGGRVAVRAWVEDGAANFEVQDWGPGIAASDAERVFDRYYRSERSRGSVAGSGLGLYIARRIAELHGGTATVISAPGAGATFRLRLPPAPVARAAGG